MKRWTMIVMVCVCALTPTTARADNGGWLDWLYRLDPKFWGVGTEFHLLCLDRSNKVIDCEEWLFVPRLVKRGRVPPPTIAYREIQHELDLRVAYYRSYGHLFPDDLSDTRHANAWRLMAMYRYHPDTHVTVGFGGGVMTFYGQDFPRFSRGVLTPLSVTYAPATQGHILKQSFYIRVESTYIKKGLDGAVFKNDRTRYATKGEWNASVAAGWDFRRRSLRSSRP
jgi:hypothetical protein